MICTLANSLWAAGCRPELARFHRATRHVAEEQEAVLRRIVRENADTEFGRDHAFSSIRTSEEFCKQVPLRNYEQHQPWIDRAADGIPNVLTRDPIRLFEPTSGSSGATKLIPYTQHLQREFQRGINAWIADLFTHCPQLLGGPAYWSISPANAARKKTPGGIAIGFDDDTSYLGGWRKRLAQSAMAVPPSVRFQSNFDECNYATLMHLVRAGNLRLISIWSPTFLTLMLDRLLEWGDRIHHDLEQGIGCAADSHRAREVREALHTSSPQEAYAKLWPQLQLISCWSDATSAGPAAELTALFPNCRIQGKGLLATEAFISFPLSECDGAALSVRSHFFEFIPSDSDRTQLAHQLEQGSRYTVVVTTGGGLYRYLLGDQIEVIGHIQDCPRLRFVGRQGSVSDWFGEKLNDAHVSRVFKETFAKLSFAPAFAMLACDTAPPPGYVLYIEAHQSEEQLAGAAELVDAALRENFHYNYARTIDQLACVRAVRIRNGANLYLEDAIRNGQSPGNVKFPALNRRDGWAAVFGVGHRLASRPS
jgi:hypothetical protein